MIQILDLAVPVVVVGFSYGVMSLGKWMMRKPERLEDAVWLQPKPLAKRDIVSTKRVGALLVFLGPFLGFMVVALVIRGFLPHSVIDSPVSFPIVLMISFYAAWKVQKRYVGAFAQRALPQKK